MLRANVSPGRVMALGVGLLPAASTAQAEPESRGLPEWFPRLLGVQATVIDQGVLPFHRRYQDDKSFKATGDDAISQTYGVYVGARLTSRLQAYVDVEMFKGAGISNATGLGGLTNGDVIRSGSVDLPKIPYIARGLLRYIVPLAAETLPVERGMDQFPGLGYESRPIGPRSRFRSSGASPKRPARSRTVSSSRMSASPTASVSSAVSVSFSIRLMA